MLQVPALQILVAMRVCVEKSQSAEGKDYTQPELDSDSFGNIIETPDAVLVADKSCARDVKSAYAELKANGHDAQKAHRTMPARAHTNTILE